MMRSKDRSQKYNQIKNEYRNGSRQYTQNEKSRYQEWLKNNAADIGPREAQDDTGWAERQTESTRVRAEDVKARRESLNNRLGIEKSIDDIAANHGISKSKATGMAKKLGFNDAEVEMVSSLLDNHSELQRAQKRYDKANGKLTSLNSSYDNIKSEIETHQKSLGALDSGTSAYNKVQSNIDSLQRQRESIEAKIKKASVPIGEAQQYMSNVKDRIGGVNSEIKGYIEKAGPDIGNKFKSLGKELGAASGKSAIGNAIRKGGKVGAIVAGGLMAVGIMQHMADSRGQMDNSQLYNPGGPM